MLESSLEKIATVDKGARNYIIDTLTNRDVKETSFPNQAKSELFRNYKGWEKSDRESHKKVYEQMKKTFNKDREGYCKLDSDMRRYHGMTYDIPRYKKDNSKIRKFLMIERKIPNPEWEKANSNYKKLYNLRYNKLFYDADANAFALEQKGKKQEKEANEMSVLLQEKLAYSDANVNRAVQMNPDGTYGMKNNLRTNFNHIKLDVKNNTNTTKIGKGINTIKSDATNIRNAFKTSGSAVGDAFKNGTSNVVGAIKNKTGVGTAIKNSTSSVGSAIKTGTGTVGNAIKGLSKGSKIGLGIAAAGTAAAIIGSKIKKKKEQNKTAETFEEMLEKMAKEQ